MERRQGKVQQFEAELRRVQTALKDLGRQRRLTEDAMRRPRGKRIQRVSAERTVRALAAAGEAAGDLAAADVFRHRNLRASGSVESLADAPMLPEARGASVEPLADAPLPPEPHETSVEPLADAPVVPEDSLCGIRAATFLQEFDLHRWVQGLNEDCGVAPSTTSVWSHWVTLRETAGEVPGVGAERRARSRKHQLQWVRRWRERWLVRYRAVPTGAALPRERLGEKAPPETDWVGAVFWNSETASAAEGGGHFRPQPLRKKRREGPKWVPFSAPQKNPSPSPLFPRRFAGVGHSAVEQFPGESVFGGPVRPAN